MQAEELQKILGRPGVLVLEIRANALVNTTENGPCPQDESIPGAVVLSLERDLSEADATLPHTLPQAAVLRCTLAKYGISPDKQIVVYDRIGIYLSPRLWWILAWLGYQNVSILDGGLPLWWARGFSTKKTLDTVPIETVHADSTHRPRTDMFCTREELQSMMREKSCLVLDARKPERFGGLVPEPRKGVRQGHIPGARNLPFDLVLQGTQYKDKASLERMFNFLGQDGKRLVMYCGSGVTACIVAYAAHLAGRTQVCVYDGSWSEWGSMELSN